MSDTYNPDNVEMIVSSNATPSAKQKIRDALSADIEAFLSSGGEIKTCEAEELEPKGRIVW